MASAVISSGGSQREEPGHLAFSPLVKKWHVGRFVESARLGRIKGHTEDFEKNVFRIGVKNRDVVHQKDVLGHTGCVNAVEFNKTEVLLASGGDDMRVFVWNVSDLILQEAPKPAAVMERNHNSNIFCYQFSLDGAELFSGGNDGIVIRHDISTTKPLSVYEERQLFRGQYNPANALYFATASNRGLTEHRRIELKDPEYSNVHTIKSVTFMDDSVVMTGSDDFNIYAWRIPTNDEVEGEDVDVSEATFVFKGHRSIVNHVRYSPVNKICSSCGVEKIIKIWSALPIPNSYDKPKIRVRKTLLSELTFDEGIAADDTAEDLNMLNYFDQLDNVNRMRAYDSNGEIGEESDDVGLGGVDIRQTFQNFVVNVDLEGLQAHLMGLDTSDEGSTSDGNDYDVERAEEDGAAEDENSARGSLRALRRRRWRMIRRGSVERRGQDHGDDEDSSPSREVVTDEDSDSSQDSDSEEPRKRLKRTADSSDSSDNEFAVCEGGVPIDVWPIRDNQSSSSPS
ncbi:unnamed protein product [Nippostrongylus brasiliensis]|uniref:DDB1- and CUL4-associated factor 5 (inferred by orthology to a human protein) n=1 Tax=Nippostrongylus brasiliensis TaxID=27835 RepID=A0A158R1F1_NIPBR|nr:unnamed protein product [Nippostrongylus brasiliensis]